MDKFFLTSKTIIGALLVVLAAFNISIPVNNDELASFLEHAQAIAGFALTVYGRFKATKPLGFSPR